jgi:hypothetical protein
MNEQLPPIDSDLREQLARRSAGRLPEGLASEVFAALDSAPPMRPIWRVPRLAVAGMSLALVAILAVTIAFSAVHTAPAASPTSLADYPAGRALTTAELASLMAGPPLPVNTALVASVTIQSRQDVCPMNSRPTVGVVEGMSSQVCVMGATLAAQLPGPTTAGTFAFRYLAPGYLGLIGEITPASSVKEAFRVVDDWPLAGKTFLVEGWLGAEGLVYPCPSLATAGDVLSPNGEDCPNDNWLSDNPSAPLIDTSVPVGPQSTRDATKLYGNARIVEAGGMRQIDSIDHGTPVHGVYVVRSVTEQCPGALPQDSRGCSAWRVLAKVAEISVPPPRGTPIASPSAGVDVVPTGYPFDRALTTPELAAVMAGPALAVNTTLVATVTIDSSEAGTPGCPMNGYPTIGSVRGMRTLVCVSGGRTTPARIPGIFAFRYLGPGALDLLGQITPASSSWPVFGATGWPWSLNGWDTFLVGGYLIREPTGWRIADTLNGPTPSPNTFLTVLVDAAAGIDSTDPSQYGVFVVTAVTVSVPASSMGPQGDGMEYHVVAKVADISVPAESTATPAPPATPVATPAASFVLEPTGLIGPGDRALTPAELSTLITADPQHLANRYVIDKRVYCESGCTDIPPTVVADTIQADGSIGLVGPLELGPDGIVWTVPQALPQYANGWQYGSAVYIIDASITGHGESGCDAPSDLCDDSWLGSGPNAHELTAQSGAFHKFGSTGATDGVAIHGLFLVQSAPGGILKSCGAGPAASAGSCSAHVGIIARLEPAAP